MPTWILFELIVTKLPHYVLPLYPAIAILIAGVVDARVLPSRSKLEQGTIWWFILPVGFGLLGLGVLIFVGRQFGFLAWPLIGAAMVMGFRAWQLYRSDGAEHALMRAFVAALLMATAIFGLVVPSLHAAFPSVALAKILRESGCKDPVAAAAGYGEAEPRLPRRHRDPADRRRRRRRLPARRRMPLRPGRGAAGAQLRAAR